LSRAFSFASSDSWAQAMIAHVWSEGAGQRYLAVDPASGTTESGALMTTRYNDFDILRWLGLGQSSTEIFADERMGEWHCVEARVRLNDSGLENGEFQLWINDALEAERLGLNWVGSFDAYGINAVYLENYWNGGAPQAQGRVLDNFVVSTERIGCP
ncbi:MAG: polysaccharide lyase, partial [Myxococcota bacterium]